MSPPRNPWTRTLGREPVYPFLVAVFPALSLYGRNTWELDVVDIVRALLACLLLAAVTLGVARLLTRSRQQAALLALVLIVGVFAYGWLDQLAWSCGIRHRYSVGGWCLAMAGVYGLGARRLRGKACELATMTTALNFGGLVLCLLTLAPILTQRGTLPDVRQESAVPELPLSSPAERPDVYYVILDAYARDDTLQRLYGLDNTAFLNWLAEKGFAVGKETVANYPHTHLSLAATLNADYLPKLFPCEQWQRNLPEDFKQRNQYCVAQMRRHIIDSRVRRFVEALGYTYVGNDKSKFAVSRNRNTPLLKRLAGPTSDFEDALIAQTIAEPLRVYYGTFFTPLGPAGSVLADLARLPQSAHLPGPKFVFLHINCPHNPLAFDENGKKVSRHPLYERSMWAPECRKVPGWTEWYRERYPKNVAGLNRHLQGTIEEWLKQTAGQAVIIFQADHGSCLGLYEDAEQTDMGERFSIFQAIYLPEKYRRAKLDFPVSSVNTFRFLFQVLYQADLPLLEDRCYFSNADYQFTDVTARVRERSDATQPLPIEGRAENVLEPNQSNQSMN